MERHNNYVAHQSFIVLCHILKENEGMYYRQIAAELKVDAALLCRWLNETVKLTSHYNERLMKYFSAACFAKYKTLLIDGIMKRLEILKSGTIAFLLEHMRYDKLIVYLFSELKWKDIEKEKYLDRIFPDIVLEAMERKAEFQVPEYIDYDVEAHAFDDCTGEVCRRLQMNRITSENTMVMRVDDRKDEKHRVLVHFDDKDEMKKSEEYMSKCRMMATLKPFGQIEHVVFLQMPEETGKQKAVPEFEKLGDYAARKILKIIKNVGQS